MHSRFKFSGLTNPRALARAQSRPILIARPARVTLICNQGVVGSNPAAGTKKNSYLTYQSSPPSDCRLPMGYRQARRLLEPLSQDAIGRAFAAVDLPEHLASACLRGRQQAMPAVVVRCFSKQMQFQRVYAEYDLG